MNVISCLNDFFVLNVAGLRNLSLGIKISPTRRTVKLELLGGREHRFFLWGREESGSRLHNSTFVGLELNIPTLRSKRVH